MSNCGTNCGDTVQGVGCTVTSCAYNTDGKRCHAGHIQVQNCDAHCKDETFCGTYRERSSKSF